MSALGKTIAARFHLRRPISVVFVSKSAMRRLNKLYRGKDKATNVLSFNLMDDSRHIADEAYLGEILLCSSVMRDEARSKGIPFLEEAQYMIVHGTLHLLKYDHESAKEAENMERMEKSILRASYKNLGKAVKNQYTE